MPRRGGKGHRAKKTGNKTNFNKRELTYKEDGQEYGQVIRLLGNGRLEAHCFDGVRRLCIIRGQMRRRVWINNDDVILIGLREYQDDRADVIHKYTPDEVKILQQQGEIPEQIRINEGEDMMEDEYDGQIQFEKFDKDEIDEI